MCPLVNNCCGFSINSFDGLPPTFYNKLGYYSKCGHFGKIVSDNNCFGRNSRRLLVDHATIGTSCIEVLIHGTFILLSWFTSYGEVGVFDTLSDSIQCLNFAKVWFIQYSIQYRFTQDSIQNIIQFKENSADSIQKIIQFNSQGIIDTGRIGKVPNDCPKSVQIRQKGGFSSKMANIDQSRCQLLKI